MKGKNSVMMVLLCSMMNELKRQNLLKRLTEDRDS